MALSIKCEITLHHGRNYEKDNILIVWKRKNDTKVLYRSAIYYDALLYYNRDKEEEAGHYIFYESLDIYFIWQNGMCVFIFVIEFKRVRIVAVRVGYTENLT